MFFFHFYLYMPLQHYMQNNINLSILKSFYSHGKLLICGEYLVLQGALALAVPCRLGQKMTVEEKQGDKNLRWTALDVAGKVWADVLLSKDDLLPFRGSLKNIDPDVYQRLQNIFQTCRKYNPAFLKTDTETMITSYLEFDRAWGLGSSSTLINNVAQFANVDAFLLNKEIFGGSGYDIACAKSDKPVFFRMDKEGVIYDSVNFLPPEPEKIYFIWLGNKQDSKTEVEKFKTQDKKFEYETEIISEISEALLFCDDFDDFMQLLDEHEDVMQYVLQEEKIKTKLFKDFKGTVKSLGAWGGDFVMAVSAMDDREIKDYFTQKGFNTILRYDELILS